ncbi:ParB N-terminal domain-containing protein [Roseateles sp. LYH14W]|uniref:ParB N-terminal domain-containing protein n=1 Tax=Pelomonas parva TaxID=3299032 RepID=A0ABW7EXD3_9BURK
MAKTSTPSAQAAAAAPPPIVRFKTRDLHFDPKNPRFYRLNNAIEDKQVIEEMLDDEGVQDLMASIGQKGYFEGEPLLVTREGGRLIVVEGNRRLAAVKLLNRQFEPPARRRSSIAELREAASVEPPVELPCIEYPDRRSSMRYLGYRHITGIKEWDSLSKAQYLMDIRQEFYKRLPKSELLRVLARDIGSRADYVGQLLTGLQLYHTAQDAKFFMLPMESKDVEFSYLTTALNYKKITDWLGLSSRDDFEMSALKDDRLQMLFSWLFPKDQQGRTIIGESRNIGKLAEIVSSKHAAAMLAKTRDLNTAYLYSEGPQQALNNALDEAQKQISIVWNMLPDTKPLTRDHLSQAEKLAEGARDVRTYIREKLED